MVMHSRATAQPPAQLYTLEEFEAMPQFGEGYELIDGRLEKKPMPGFEHAAIADNIRDANKAYASPRKLGRVQREASITIGIPRNAPIPDLSFWKAERKVKIVKGAAPLPDLAVEVFSPGDLAGPTAFKSAMVKVKKLIQAGVPIVWVVNPDEQTVAVYHAGQPDAPVKTEGIKGEVDGENVIPGFKMAVADVFAVEEED